MKLVLNIFIVIYLTSCIPSQNLTTRVNVEEKVSEPKRILDSIITVAKDQSLYREKVNWKILEEEVYNHFKDSDSISSLIEPVQFLLAKLGDFHGSLIYKGVEYKGNVNVVRNNIPYDYRAKEYFSQMNLIYQKNLKQDDINGHLIDDKIAYIEIPVIKFNGTNQNENILNTLKIRAKICELKKEKPKGWIIDLRGCLGGNIHPMLMGLAEILPLKVDMGGDSYDGKSIRLEWKLNDGVFYYGDEHYSHIPTLECHSEKEEKIVVLIGRYTASSGEVVACALKGQKNIKLFGEITAGSTTSNNWVPIGKEVVFNLATSYYVSKDKTVHKDGIIPDQIVNENFDFRNPLSGKVFNSALKYLNSVI